MIRTILMVIITIFLTACGGSSSALEEESIENNTSQTDVSTNSNISTTLPPDENISVDKNNSTINIDAPVTSSTVATSGGNSNSGGNNNPIVTKNAVLLDAIVKGARYDAGSGVTGFTDANGLFRYVEGQAIKFYIGNVFIGEGHPVDKPAGVTVVTDKILTPLGFVGAGDDIDNPKALKIVRFLIALDRDNNPDNGIDIDIDRVLGHDLALLDAHIDLGVIFGNKLTLPNHARAREHFCQSLGRTDCSQAPIITGTPKTTTNVYGTYQFLPIASDINNDTLTFSIQNKPAWAEFNTTTGLLKGMPTAELTHSNIIISVSDGSETVSLAPFAIEVQPAINLAHFYGKATQGDTWDNKIAGNAIDNDIATYNHANDVVPNNWWQLELLAHTKIHKIVIHNSISRSARLANAKMYINNQTHVVGSTDMGTFDKTFTNEMVQIFTYDPPVDAHYILMQGNLGSGSKSLHMGEVKVYGELPDKPYFGDDLTLGLEPNSAIGTVVGSVKAEDFQNDTLTYSMVGDVPFEIDSSSGLVKLTQLVDHNVNQSYTFTVNASDGKSNSSTSVTVKLLSKSGATLEHWYNIDGCCVTYILNSNHYKNDVADNKYHVDALDTPSKNIHNQFAQKLSALLKPAQSGEYIFAISADYRARLYLSTDDSNMIAEYASEDPYQDWANAGKSQPITLKQGQLYNLMALHKDWGGLEYVSVGWKRVGDAEFTLIPANQLFIKTLNSDNVKPIFETHVADFTIQSANTIGDKVISTRANDAEGDSLTYTIIGDVPFVVDANGQITISGSLEIQTYSFDIEVTDGTYTTSTHVNVTSTANTAGLNDTKEDFYTKAKAFTADSNVDELVTSYLAFAHEKAQSTYDEFMPESSDANIWTYIENNPTIKEGLYASRFPVNPHFVKNLADIKAKWVEDGKDATFIAKYKNVALGLAINAREAGVFKEVSSGDTWEHPTIDYSKLAGYEAKEKRWREHFDYLYLGYGINANGLKKYMKIKYQLSYSEADSIWHSRIALKNILTDVGDVANITYAKRVEHGLSFDGLNVYRLSLGLSRENCTLPDNPCTRINTFITNTQDMTKTKFLGDFKNYKTEVSGLIKPLDSMAFSLRGELGLIPKEKNDYRLMSFYDLANWKITNDETPAKDFGDSEPNWPIFSAGLSTLPWQLLALTQSAQKQECVYVKSRFFETDKAVLRDTYPPNAVDSRTSSKESRFKQYTSYTWDYNKPEVWYRESDWSPHRSYYRVLQDGGVCGRQSTMGQHLNECLNRPSIGVGQPGHRAWVGVYNSTANVEQYQTDIGYQVGSRESASAHSELIYNQYTKVIRETGMERITGVATGVSPASAGEHVYNQSMIFQHIGKLLAEDGASAEAVLKKSVDLVPNNVDAWYQFALYYASLDKPEKVIVLAKEFMDKRATFFVDLDARKGAENMEVVTGKNIAFIAIEAPSIDGGKGDDAELGETKLWEYLDTYEVDNRSVRSYRNQNRYLAKKYLQKEEDESGFADAVESLFSRFLANSDTGYYSRYFEGVEFGDANKTELFNTLQDLTDTAQITDNKKDEIYKEILGRESSEPLASAVVNDICIDSNLLNCQSVKSFNLNSKTIYITVDDRVGEDAEVAPLKRGENGYSTLTIPTVDDLGKDMDIKVRIAKIATTNGINGTLFKINDPSEVATDKTKLIAWIDPSDNSFEEGRLYTAGQKIVLKVTKRVPNNQEFMGNVILNLKDLMQGHALTFNGETFTQKYIDNTTSVYFTTLDIDIGPTGGNWFHSGYTTLSIRVKDENGVESVLKLRANNNGRKMNAGQNAGWDNTLQIIYDSTDNSGLVSGMRYKTITPFVLDARMWHKERKVKDRMYIGVDMVVE